MSIPGSASPLFFQTAAVATDVGYQIEKSVRLNDNDNARFDRTFSSSGNQRTWTVSMWFKRGNLGSPNKHLFDTTGSPEYTGLYTTTDDKMEYRGYTSGFNWVLTTTQRFRDPSAWTHIVVNFNSTASTSTDRLAMYINGSKVDDFDLETYPSQNHDSNWNNNVKHTIGGFGSSNTWDGYIADIHSIDGQALAASSFGEFDDSGVWRPKEYSGTFGTNGFHILDFANEATAGHDSSGNSHDFAQKNLQTSEEKATGYVTGSGTPANASGSGGWSQAFDGSTSTLIYNSNGSTTTTFNLHRPLAWTSKIRIYAGQNATSGTNIIANGTNLSSSHTWPLAGGWQEVTSSLTSPLTSLGLTSVGGQSSNIRAVEIDDTIVVQVEGEDVDLLFDSPTNGTQTDAGAGAEVTGNYATWNPLGDHGTFSQGNTTVSLPASGKSVIQTIFPESGKWYVEILFISGGGAGGGLRMGVINEHNIKQDLGSTANSWAYLADGRVYHNASAPSYGVSSAPGDLLMMALDIDAGKVWYGKNGSWMASGDPANGSNASQTFTAGQKMSFSVQSGSGTVQVVNANWGQRGWSYDAPTGFKAVCTANLATPTIADGSTAFDIDLYTGTGSTHERSEFSFSPDLVWIKQRNIVRNNLLFDTLRGANKFAVSNSSGTPGTGSGMVTSFDSDGFTVGNSADVNQSSGTFCAWCWDAGSSTVSNTDGNITSNVRANQTAGFSIVTYTGDGDAAGTVGHGLNAAPGMVIVKATNVSKDWKVAHSSLSTQYMFSLNTTSQQGIASWNGMTSSVFKPARSGDTYLNTSGETYVAYCFAPVAGYSAMGHWSGNSSANADQPFIYCGFRPAFIMWVKYAGQNDNRFIFDTARDPYNRAENWLNPNTNAAETSDVYNKVDIVSNGFKLRVDNAAYGSNTSHSFLFYAVAEHPFQANGGLAR